MNSQISLEFSWNGPPGLSYVSESREYLYREYDINPLLECYSNAALHRHHADNKNYAIVSSDEGHRILAGIASKEGRSVGERALINKLWNGKGEKAFLKAGWARP